MNMGYIENPETGKRKDVIVDYHQPIAILIVSGLVGFAIGVIGRYEFNRGVKAYDNEMNQTLVELNLMDNK